MKKNIKKIETILLDFDGVLTNNRVIINELGKEHVICNRSDGLAIEVLKKKKFNILVISTEKNNVVQMRCKKLGIKCINAVDNKKSYLDELHRKNILDLSKSMYVGNDINDYHAMRNCYFSCCPKDSHKKIKKIANITLTCNGGDGVIMEIVERVFKINMLDYL